MDKRNFAELFNSVRDMGRHMRGEPVAGVTVREFPEPDVKAIRERTGLLQSQSGSTDLAACITGKPKAGIK